MSAFTPSIVRLRTTFWSDRRGMHQKRSLTYLRRLGRDPYLEEEVSMIGADLVWDRIINLDECKDGIYEAVICNEQKDWETGQVEDYDFKLVPYIPSGAPACTAPPAE